MSKSRREPRESAFINGSHLRALVLLGTLVAIVGWTPSSRDGRSASEKTLAAISLRVAVTDWTEKTATPKTEVWVRGTGSWFPDLQFGGDVRVFEGYEIGTTVTLFFYPVGRDEPEIQVPVKITTELCPQGCARDMVHLEIYDDHFEVWGNPVESQEVPR